MFCSEVFVSIFNAPPWNEQWREKRAFVHLRDICEAPGAFGMVARDKGGVVGFALGQRKLRDLSTSFYVQEMCVLEEHQGQGVGRQILAGLEAKLEEQGINSLYLLTARDSAAEAFYETSGFYSNEGVIVMTKQLG